MRPEAVVQSALSLCSCLDGWLSSICAPRVGNFAPNDAEDSNHVPSAEAGAALDAEDGPATESAPEVAPEVEQTPCPHAHELIWAAAGAVCRMEGFPEHRGEVYLRVCKCLADRGIETKFLRRYARTKLTDYLERVDQAWGEERRAHLTVDTGKVEVARRAAITNQDDDEELRRDLLELVADLPAHEVEVVRLKYWGEEGDGRGMPTAMIGLKLGKSRELINQILDLAHARLREALSP